MSAPSPSTPLPDERSQSLNGLGVLVTRPEHQADALCQLIKQHGGTAIRWPALVITEPRDWTPALAIFDQLADYNLAIFTSTNAVDRALPLIQERGGFPPQLDIAAIGQATAQALERQGVTRCLRPAHGFTSEALLELPRLQHVAGQNIVIIRGEGGREWLADTLIARDAWVARAEVYRRQPPAVDAKPLLDRWAQGEIGAVLITSTESLRNLFDMLKTAGQNNLRDTPLVVVSARIRQIAVEYGCRYPLLARDASNQAILAALFGLTTNPPPPLR
ncbi:MAG TPA: uroporphyrinogen-III synthase [Candidatus Competibacteraceae bacterium]|nr:uroporphyrinogen-III synthase [Candidatus Competibacteraceae bacterium]